MPKVKPKKARPGRNDPCWCGSGRKYKDCHMPLADALRSRQRKLRQAQDTLLPKIIEVTQSMPDTIPPALELFWQGKYTPEQMTELDDLEDRGAERFLTWLAFDYLLDNGHTLVETLAESGAETGFEADEYEAQLLREWASVRMRPYVVEEVTKGKGMVVRDLLNDAVLYVEDHAASRRIEPEEVLVGHVVPVGAQVLDDQAAAYEATSGLAESTDVVMPSEPSEHDIATRQIYYVAGAVAHLTSDTGEKVVEFANLHLEDAQRAHPETTLDDLPRLRSHVFNHFVMELPEEHTPGLLDDVLLRTRTALQLAGVPLPMARSTDKNDNADEEAAAPDEEPHSSAS